MRLELLRGKMNRKNTSKANLQKSGQALLHSINRNAESKAKKAMGTFVELCIESQQHMKLS